MKRILAGLLFLLVICVSGCRQPVGSIDTNGNGYGNGNGNGNNAGDLDFMWLVPNRQLYETDDSFDKYNDMQILVAEDGRIMKVLASDSSVTVEILRYPGVTLEDPETIPVKNQFYPFAFPGRHDVRVTYNKDTNNEQVAKYTITVQGQYIEGGDGSGFLETVWR